jgi:hypothetical protein
VREGYVIYVLTSPSGIVRLTTICLCVTNVSDPVGFRHTDVLLAFCASLIILYIVSTSYGKVEDLEVITSMIVGFLHE